MFFFRTQEERTIIKVRADLRRQKRKLARQLKKDKKKLDRHAELHTRFADTAKALMTDDGGVAKDSRSSSLWLNTLSARNRSTLTVVEACQKRIEAAEQELARVESALEGLQGMGA